MYPGHWGRVTPEKPALVVAETGEVITHGQLDERSTRLARAWRSAGLSPGDRVAVFMENHPRYLEVVWAALRSGVVITPVNRYLTAGSPSKMPSRDHSMPTHLIAPEVGR